MYSRDGVRQERSGWRDLSLSDRHRKWGYDCPAVDIDFLMVEFNQGRPAALVEYKHQRAMIPNLNSPTYRALQVMADAANVPMLLVFYNNGPWWFRVTPVNDIARKSYSPNQIMSEREYVVSLYKLRNITPSVFTLRSLETWKPA